MRDDGGQRLQVVLLFPMTQHGMPILQHHRLNLRIASDARIVPNPSRCHFPQLAMESFRRTKNIEIGSAVVSILASGGPIAQAERIANTLQLLAVNDDARKLHVGFSAGRFEFMARPYGIVPRTVVEEAAWPALRGQIFLEASEIFLRLLRGDVVSSDSVRSTTLTRENFRSDEDWQRVQDAHGSDVDAIDIDRRYVFEDIRIVPNTFDRNQLVLVAGTHDPKAQVFVNSFLPVRVFNLSITQPDVIEATHKRMRSCFHPDGGEWKRSDMPRTSFVFVNDEPDMTPEEQRQAAENRCKVQLRLASVERLVCCWTFVFQLKGVLVLSIPRQSPRNLHIRVVRSSSEAWSVRREYGHQHRAFG